MARLSATLLDGTGTTIPPVAIPMPGAATPTPQMPATTTGDLTLSNGTIISGTGAVIPPNTPVVQTPLGVAPAPTAAPVTVPKGALNPALLDGGTVTSVAPVTPPVASTPTPVAPAVDIAPPAKQDLVLGAFNPTPTQPVAPTPVQPATPTAPVPVTPPVSTPVTPPKGAANPIDVPVAPPTGSQAPPPSVSTPAPSTGAPNGALNPGLIDQPVAPPTGSQAPPPPNNPSPVIDTTIPHGAVLTDAAGNIIDINGNIITNVNNGSPAFGGQGSGPTSGVGNTGNPPSPPANSVTPVYGGSTPPPDTTVVPASGMAYDIFRDTLISLAGFSSADDQMIRELYTASQTYLSSGVSISLIPDLLANSPNAPASYKAYVQNFNNIKGNVTGITTLAEWNQARSQYKQLMTSYGLTDLATNASADQFLQNGVSVSEAASRLNVAFDAINNADTALKQQLATYFPSLAPKDLAASILGVGKTAAELQKTINIAGIQAEQKLAGGSSLNAADLAAQGVTRAQARAGMQQTAQEIMPFTAAAERAQISTQDLQKELESENVLGLASQRRKRIQAAEQNLFQGSSGTGQPSLTSASSGRF